MDINNKNLPQTLKWKKYLFKTKIGDKIHSCDKAIVRGSTTVGHEKEHI